MYNLILSLDGTTLSSIWKNSNKDAEIGMGDAVDDLSDIIYDLLEVKWRLEHTSETDAWWHFLFTFQAHTQQHLIDLLNYLKNKYA